MAVKQKLEKYLISSDEENIRTGDTAIILETEVDVDFDNIRGVFEPNLLYYYIVDLEYKKDDEVENTDADNGYPASFKCKHYEITKIWEKTY